MSDLVFHYSLTTATLGSDVAAAKSGGVAGAMAAALSVIRCLSFSRSSGRRTELLQRSRSRPARGRSGTVVSPARAPSGGNHDIVVVIQVAEEPNMVYDDMATR